MRKIDFYVLGEIVAPFFGGILFFLFISMMFQVLHLTEFFIIHGVPGGILLKMLALMALSFMPFALPVAFLVAVLVGFGRLSTDSELIAMKASGISPNRLAAPILVLAGAIVALSLFLDLKLCPWGERESKDMLIRVSNTKAVSSIHEGTFTSGFFDLLIFADKVDTKTGKLNRVFIFDEREPKNPLTVVAQAGELFPVRTTGQYGTAAMLRLYEGSIHSNDLTENTYQKIGFGEYNLYLKVDEGSGDASPRPQSIEYEDLLGRIGRTTTATFEGREMRGEFWRRWALALSPLIFVYLGIGLGTVRVRAVRAGAALTTLLILILYWVLQAAGTIALQKAMIPPLPAEFLPDFVLLAVAIPAYRRASW
jgi:lipopolysaccharide export system permease protein